MTEPVAPEVPTNDPVVEKWVKQFVFLRDYVKQKDDEHKTLLAPLKADMETLKGKLLEFLKATGGNNMATPAGSFYRTTRHSCSITDQKEFMDFVIGGELWDLMDKKANATAVREWMEENNKDLKPGENPVIVPGVNLTTLVDVNVNRPRAK